MKILSISFYIILFSLLLASCRNDSIEEQIIDIPEYPSIAQQTNVTGLIKDENNVALADVEITINDVKTTTDERGVFVIRNTVIYSAGTAAKFEKADYFTSYRILYLPKAKDKLYVEINMTPMSNSATFNSSVATEINVGNGAKVSFEANSIVQEYNNQEFNGEVTVISHWYNPADEDLGLTGPASLIGQDKDGNEKGLYTYGMMAIELQSEFGTALNLKTGTDAELTFPIPSDILEEAPETIPLWYVDEATGIWKEEGQAQKVGNEYVGKVGHFSFWNCDYPYDLVDIEGYLLTPDGSPLANYPVYIKRQNLWGAYGYTNNVGYFSGKVPANELLNLIISHCGVTLVDQEIGPLSTATDLGDYTVQLTDFVTTVTGTMVGCMGEPLTDAYGIIYPSRIIIPAVDGSFSTVETGCGAVNLEAQFFNGALLHETDLIPIDKDADLNSLGTISICNDIQNYISFSIDNNPYRVIPDPTIAVVNSSGFVLKGNTDGYEFNWSMRVSTLDLVVTNPDKVEVYSKLDINNPGGPDGNQGGLACENESPYIEEPFLCDQFEVDILEVNLVENYIRGTFNGELAGRDSTDEGTNSMPQMVQGSFRSPITKNFDEASINGKVWFDLNDNGTRDADEEDTAPAYASMSLIKNDGTFEFGNSYTNIIDGEYTFDQLEPGDYTIRLYAYPYETTIYQAGDPAKDNDFQMEENIFTASVVLSNGENAINIDAGLKSPDEVFCFINPYGCAPDVMVQYTISGGVPPYSVTFSNGFSDVTSQSFGIIEVGTGGDYELQIEDALGNVCSTTADVPDFRNSVAGWVWQDAVGGEDGLYDQNIDVKLSGFTVNLYQADGTLYQSYITNASFNGFYIDELPYGDYYIEVDVPAGEELVDVNTDDYNGSSINPGTSRSDVFSITECNTNLRKNIGFKL